MDPGTHQNGYGGAMMTQEEFIGLSETERRGLFDIVSDQCGLTSQVVEKDFWVTYVLGKMFGDHEIAEAFRFKGGTSLSKGYGLIDRFSEDVDLVVEWDKVPEKFGCHQLVSEVRSARNARKLQSRLNELVPNYTQDHFLPKIQGLLPDCLVCHLPEKKPSGDEGVICIDYPQIYGRDDAGYISPNIRLEMGVLAASCPNEPKSVESLLTSTTHRVDSPDAPIPTVTKAQTFWEKISILHREHYRDEVHPYLEGATNRTSRHYYDVFKILGKVDHGDLLREFDLLSRSIWYSRMFHRCPWAKLEEAESGDVHLMPSDYARKILQEDYKNMQVMIWEKKPVAFDEILDAIVKFEREIEESVKK